MITRRPVIGLDLDECLGAFNATIARFYNQTHGTSLTIKDFHSFKYWEVWGGTPEDTSVIVKQFFKSPLFLNGIPTIQGSKEALTRLHSRYDIYIVTSRHREIESVTKEWLAMNYPGLIDRVLIGNFWSKDGARLSKREMLEEIHADVFIDDNYGYVHDCKDCVKAAILFGNYGWNRRANSEDYRGMYCCSDWEQVVALLMDMKFEWHVFPTNERVHRELTKPT